MIDPYFVAFTILTIFSVPIFLLITFTREIEHSIKRRRVRHAFQQRMHHHY